MSEEGPKLYNNKPKKARLKQGLVKAKDSTVPPSSSSSPAAAAAAAAAASYSMGSQGGSTHPSPPPPPPKESFARRYKFLWPLLLTVNLAVGGINEAVLTLIVFPVNEIPGIMLIFHKEFIEYTALFSSRKFNLEDEATRD